MSIPNTCMIWTERRSKGGSAYGLQGATVLLLLLLFLLIASLYHSKSNLTSSPVGLRDENAFWIQISKGQKGAKGKNDLH